MRSRCSGRAPVDGEFHARYSAARAHLPLSSCSTAPVRPALEARHGSAGSTLPLDVERDARGGGARSSASTISPRSARPSARRRRRCARCTRSRSSAHGDAHRLRRCARTRSCTTWCATSSARWSTSARASIRRRGSTEVLASRRTAARRRRPSRPRACTSRTIAVRCPAGDLPPMRTRDQDLRHHARRGRARGRAGRRRRDRPGVLSAEPALSLGRARGRDARRAAAVRADGGAVREPRRARRWRRCSAACSPAMLQFHGDETPEFCGAVRRAVRQGRAQGRRHGRRSALEYLRPFSRAAAWLLDSHRRRRTAASARASTGRSCRRERERPLILSGGLDAGERRPRRSARAALGRGRVERRRVGEGHQGRREDRRFHRGGPQCRCMTCPTRAAISAPTAASSSPRR